MRLFIDQGNTRLKWMLVDKTTRKRCYGVFDYQIHEWALLAKHLTAQTERIGASIERIAVATVAGRQQLSLLQAFTERYFHQTPWIAQTERQWRALTNSYQDITKMGVDRWLAAVGAEALYPTARKIVIDAGSAITVECLSETGEHLGGYIGPGLRLLQSSLLGATADVEAQVQMGVEQRQPGKNTQDAVSAAALQMSLGLVSGALQTMQTMVPPSTLQPIMIFTGGDGNRLHSFFPASEYRPHLVLEGLEARCDDACCP